VPSFVEIPPLRTEISPHAKKFRDLAVTLTFDLCLWIPFINGHSTHMVSNYTRCTKTTVTVRRSQWNASTKRRSQRI